MLEDLVRTNQRRELHAACRVTIKIINGWLQEEAGNRKSHDHLKAYEMTLLENPLCLWDIPSCHRDFQQFPHPEWMKYLESGTLSLVHISQQNWGEIFTLWGLSPQKMIHPKWSLWKPAGVSTIKRKQQANTSNHICNYLLTFWVFPVSFTLGHAF